MKTALKYIVIGILTLVLQESIGQKNISSKIEVFKNFSESDFERIEKDYKYSFSKIENLFGVALLNKFPQIKNKFQVQLQINSDSIELISVTHEGRYLNLTNNYQDFYNGQIFIDYFYKGRIFFFRYEKRINSKKIESLYSDKNETKYIKFYGDYGECIITDKLSEERIEGKYNILEEPKVDTLITFNQLNYEEWVTIKRNDLEKIGEWKYFDKDGKLIKIEKNKTDTQQSIKRQ